MNHEIARVLGALSPLIAEGAAHPAGGRWSRIRRLVPRAATAIADMPGSGVDGWLALL